MLDHVDYLKELGVNYVHFMPCLKPRPGDSDGGYSVMDYRSINPDLGTMDEFRDVAAALRAEGMSVCIDLVLNHTAKEHEWALKARAGDAVAQSYYWVFDTDELPKAYERTLVEIFPANAPGNFTFYPDMGKWVWTTFNEHQWDLNWSNPRVFLEVVDIMLHLANQGAEVLRLDAVAFMWKRMGTNCQNLPEVPAMKGLLDGVSDADLAAMAKHFSGQALKPQPGPRDAARFARGEQVANGNRCASCHLPNYAGREQMPRLAGQREDYLLHSMRQFLSGHATGRDTIMAASLRGLSDADLQAMAHYFAQLPP